MRGMREGEAAASLRKKQQEEDKKLARRNKSFPISPKEGELGLTLISSGRGRL